MKKEELLAKIKQCNTLLYEIQCEAQNVEGFWFPDKKERSSRYYEIDQLLGEGLNGLDELENSLHNDSYGF